MRSPQQGANLEPSLAWGGRIPSDKFLLRAVGSEVWGSPGLPGTGFSASEASAFLGVVQHIWAKPFLILLLLLPRSGLNWGSWGEPALGAVGFGVSPGTKVGEAGGERGWGCWGCEIEVGALERE